MKIVLISGHSESLINFRGNLLKAFVDSGNQVTVLGPSQDCSIISELANLRVCYEYYPLKRNSFNPVGDLFSLCKIYRLLRKLSPDTVLSYMVKPNIYGSYAAYLAGVPKVYSMVTGLGHPFLGSGIRFRVLNYIVRQLYQFGLRENTAVFFQNQDDLTLFKDSGILAKNKKTVLVNGSGVDIDHYKPTHLIKKPLVFLMISRLIKEKGVFEYIDAARIIKVRYPEVVFRFVTRPDSNPSSIDISHYQKWKQSGVVEILDYAKDVRPYIAEASVYVLPSYREGTPRTVLEAMSMGRPVITTDTAGCRQTVIDSENGFLVPVKDVNTLVQAMERFIEDPELINQMGSKGRDLAVKRYDVHKVNTIFMETMGLAQNASV
jgi:glycosyltransferase involved in cell wall biosynthesis